MVLTHAHLDHSGSLPLLTRHDFSGNIICSRPTADLCGILLPDSGHLHEKDAEFSNRPGFSRHKPDSVNIHGSYVSVRADVKNLDMLSGHADAGEILRWLRGFKSPPRTTFITHGEPAASETLRLRIIEELGRRCVGPEHSQKVTLE